MRILFLSDTHGLHRLVPELPEADVFIHAGDFMNGGTTLPEINSFNKWAEGIPAKRKICIAGNHDRYFETDPKRARKCLTNIEYYENEGIEIDGIKFWFSPVTPFFLNWAFNVDRGEAIKKYWDLIPEDTNILVTHGPPYGILDKIIPEGTPGDDPFNLHLGCEELGYRVSSLTNLKYHVFGHIHGSRGELKPIAKGLDKITFINASFLNERYRPHPGPGYFLVEV